MKIDLMLISGKREKILAEIQAEKERHLKTLCDLEQEQEDLNTAEKVFWKITRE